METTVEEGLRRLLRLGLKRLPDGARPVLVVSHERSGTHFVMNSLAACLGYASTPWINLDFDDFNINYYSPSALLDVMQALIGLRSASLIKSHHEAAFFAEIMDQLDGLDIVYVYRRPPSVMSSYWRFLHTWPWTEGPKVDTALDFANAAPSGALMRYQQAQRSTMLDRWAEHVQGWLGAAERHPNIHPVRYEDLDSQFEATIEALSVRLGRPLLRVVRPERNVIGVGAGPEPAPPPPSDQHLNAIWRLAMQRHPDLMARLGYVYASGLRVAI